MLIQPGALGLIGLSLGLSCESQKEEAMDSLTPLPFQPTVLRTEVLSP